MLTYLSPAKPSLPSSRSAFDFKNFLILKQQGEGPVHLIGSHCIDFFGGVDEEADTEDEDDEMEVG